MAPHTTALHPTHASARRLNEVQKIGYGLPALREAGLISAACCDGGGSRAAAGVAAVTGGGHWSVGRGRGCACSAANEATTQKTLRRRLLHIREPSCLGCFAVCTADARYKRAVSTGSAVMQQQLLYARLDKKSPIKRDSGSSAGQ
eukprot:6202777-Pleurochrysis_carterae.AAC.2